MKYLYKGRNKYLEMKKLGFGAEDQSYQREKI
jgi:hypothetical protein